MAQIGLSDQIAKPRIAIIGGGYAGMAAAVALMDAGITDLTLYEAGPILGGVPDVFQVATAMKITVSIFALARIPNS